MTTVWWPVLIFDLRWRYNAQSVTPFGRASLPFQYDFRDTACIEPPTEMRNCSKGSVGLKVIRVGVNRQFLQNWKFNIQHLLHAIHCSNIYLSRHVWNIWVLKKYWTKLYFDASPRRDSLLPCLNKLETSKGHVIGSCWHLIVQTPMVELRPGPNLVVTHLSLNQDVWTWEEKNTYSRCSMQLCHQTWMICAGSICKLCRTLL